VASASSANASTSTRGPSSVSSPPTPDVSGPGVSW
jgi:hypothetical protein